MPPKTSLQLENSLRRALKQPTCKLKEARLDDCTAELLVEGHPGRVAQINVDKHQAGFITAVIHELIHFVYWKEFDKWGELEEPLVEALEALVVKQVLASPSRTRWWRQAINRKLGR